MTMCKSALACDRLPWEEPYDFQRQDDFVQEPIVNTRTAPMTIGEGILCNNGIVLATDTEYTTGSLKTFGPKLFKAADRRDVAAIIAGAGSVSFMKTAAEKIGIKIGGLPKDPNTESVKDAAEEALLQFYKTHVYPVPEGIRPQFGLLIGVWTAVDGLRLYKSNLTNIVQEPTYATIGVGQYVACYAVDLVRGRDIGVEQGKVIAAFSIKAAKDYVSGCGKKTNIWTLDEVGNIQRLSPAEIKDLEEYCEDLTNALQFAQLGLDIGEISKDEMDALVGDFRQSLTDFKEKQQKRAEAREKALMKMAKQQ